MRMDNPTPAGADNFSTKDFWLAGALLASGKMLLRLDWQGGRAYFVFDNAIACEEAAEAYWAGRLQVSAKAFTDGLRTLKDRLYQRPGNEHGHEQQFSS